MKKTLLLIGTLFIATITSCSTTVTTTTMPNGNVVTVTAKSSDPAAIAAALETAKLIAPIVQTSIDKQKATIVTPTK